MENELRLKKHKTLKFNIIDSDGNDTGNFLEFDLEDVELPINIIKAQVEHEKNKNWIKTKFIAIEKKEDKSGKYVISQKEEEKVKALKEYFEKEIKALNLFLGDGAIEKLLNGRKPYLNMFEDICEELEPIMPIIEENVQSAKDIIINKYKKEEGNVLE